MYGMVIHLLYAVKLIFDKFQYIITTMYLVTYCDILPW